MTVPAPDLVRAQALSERHSSGAFGFGTSTRKQREIMYVSPAHLRELYGKFTPAPDTYTLQSSLGRQVRVVGRPAIGTAAQWSVT